MISEELEFQISQYLDNTLSGEDRVALEAKLAGDAELRKVFEEYERLDHRVLKTQAVPSLNWDKLAAWISRGLDEPENSAVIGRIGWTRRLAIAASLLIAIGLALRFAPRRSIVHQPIATAVIVGPQVESATGPAVQQITVGPSPALAAQADTWRYAEGVITRPTHIELAGEIAPTDEITHVR